MRIKKADFLLLLDSVQSSEEFLKAKQKIKERFNKNRAAVRKSQARAKSSRSEGTRSYVIDKSRN